MTSQLIGPMYTNVTYFGVCVLSVLYPRMTSQLIGPLYTNVTYLGVCVVSTTVCLKKISRTFLAVTLENIVGFS